MQKLYNAELFDCSGCRFISHHIINEPSFSFDYLTLEPIDISVVRVHPVQTNPGDYIRVTELSANKLIFCGLIQSVEDNQMIRNVTVITAVPLLSLLNVPLMRADWSVPEGTELTEFLKNMVSEVYLDSGDVVQKMNIQMTANGNITDWKLSELEDALESNGTVNIWNLFSEAFEKYGVVAEMEFMPQTQSVALSIGTVSATATLEADANYILEKTVVIGSDYGATNKRIYFNSTKPTEQAVYYLYSDGSYGTDASNSLRISPVVWEYSGIAPESGKTFATLAEENAKNDFAGQVYENEIRLSFSESGSRLVNPERLKIGTVTDVISGGKLYRSILSGWELSNHKYTLVFGSVREELTKKMILERRF